MNVLMFGWEFPPHISGGLGTACFGLTQALVAEGIGLTFVVPKLNGDECLDGASLCDGSTVDLAETTNHTAKTLLMHKHHSDLMEYTRHAAHQMTMIEVPAQLSPYNHPHLRQPVYTIEQWSDHRIVREEKRNVISTIHEHKMHAVPSPRHCFAGGYGQNLILEVLNYSDVGHALGSSETFDVIHAHDWMTYPAGIAAKRASGKPLIVHVHATEFDRSGTDGLPDVYGIERAGLHEADRIVAVSEWTKNMLMNKYHVAADTISVVHNGIIRDNRPLIREEHPMARNLVTFLGRVTFQKGPEYFVDSAVKILQHFPDTHFVMAGSGDALPAMIARVARLRLSHCFHFTGFLRKPEIDRILSYTRAFVMPSVSEPFGITPLEAVQAGVPIIISKQSGIAEVMPHALKVDFWDTDAIANAVCSVLNYTALSKSLSDNAHRALDSITWTKAARQLTEIYTDVTQ
jgi:glycosyltransferase involved in cell wall biosynthesis